MRRSVVVLCVALIACAGLAFAAEADQREAFVIEGGHVAPEYPPAALAAGFEAVVTVAGVINEDGTVGAVEVLDSTNSKLGFEEAALSAFRQWKFAPAVQSGEPVMSVWAYDFHFAMAGGRLKPTPYVGGEYITSILGNPGSITDPKRGITRDPGLSPQSVKEQVVFTKPRKPPCNTPGCMYDRSKLLPPQRRYPSDGPPPGKVGGNN